ncbi:MAG: type IV pilus modification protein PilV [Gammaproteobacteria bacterium]|nr:MAG: type IV pilus modification protein PilV [Gammaproteobacteria bacterium]
MDCRVRTTMQTQAGITMVEVLVTVLVLSVGLLGLASLQAVALRNNISGYERSQATVMAMDILDKMRLNRTAARAGNYDVDFDKVPADYTGSGEIDLHLNEWLTSLENTLPSGDGSIDCTTDTPLCVITVRWNDARSNGAADSYQTFVVSAEL